MFDIIRKIINPSKYHSFKMEEDRINRKKKEDRIFKKIIEDKIALNEKYGHESKNPDCTCLLCDRKRKDIEKSEHNYNRRRDTYTDNSNSSRSNNSSILNNHGF